MLEQVNRQNESAGKADMKGFENRGLVKNDLVSSVGTYHFNDIEAPSDYLLRVPKILDPPLFQCFLNRPTFLPVSSIIRV